ncbi:ATP-binding protein [Thermococcus aggregans]|uniref:ATP-binding protein n=1 Tax=Thermococcus aggregans TaxID=110163 RepID=A0A9E7SNM7_THEAG|nr:ATP-binding protein [Thermococcus aggregans]USS40658.1 ATP-binding protein [Thermococcus aggregans]
MGLAVRIVEVEIENFRSLRHVKIPVDDLTILIGRNGTGKSSLLKALDLFFNPNSKYTEEDFYGKDTSKPIKITLKFELDTTEEIEEFQKYVREEGGRTYIKVVKIMKFSASKSNQSYHGVRLGIPQFSEARSLKREDLVQKYNELRQEFPDLPNLGRTPAKKAILKALEEYESLHPEMCAEILVEDQFFGYKEVGRGKIEKFIKFQLVPAIKDVSEETEYKKGSIITELTQLIIEEHIRSIPGFKHLEDKYKNLLKTLEKKGRKTETKGLLTELSHEITQILEKFAPNTKAYINWDDLEDFKMPLPTPRVSIEEDGFKVSVDRVGHGTQRALLFSLLHYLAEKKYETSNTEDTNENSANENSKLTLFLAIEELELYQHPQRQKHLKKTV